MYFYGPDGGAAAELLTRSFLILANNVVACSDYQTTN